MNSLLAPEETRVTHEPSVMEILSQAVLSGNVAVDVIERLTKLQREQVEYQAMVDFNEALQRCQDGLQPIRATIDNSQTGSKYANYVQLDKAIRPIYSKEGFSLSFSTEESASADTVIVVCMLSRGGHSRKYQIPMATDGKGPKGGAVMTRTHAIGAASSYGMRYLLKMIFNLAVGEDDNDGNGVGPEIEGARNKILHGMERAQGEDQLTSLYRAGVKDALAARDYDAIPMFDKLRDKRRRELAGEID